MNLDYFASSLLRRWYLVLLLAAVGAFGTYLYFLWNGKQSVTATVAVWEPTVVRAADAQQAQVSFAPIAQSYLVAERVVQQLGLKMSPLALQGEVSVKLANSLVPALASPLYTLSVSDRDPNRALQIANAVIAQSRQVFVQLNTIDPSQIEASFQPRETDLQNQLSQAEAALQKFEDANNAYDLPGQLSTQVALVNSLRQQSRSNSSGQGAAALAEEQKTLNDAKQQLAHLRSLQPDFDRLSFDVVLAGNAVSQLASLQTGSAVVNTSAAKSQISQSQTALTTALNALAAFENKNGIGDLPTEIATQTSNVNDLLRLQQQAQLARGTSLTQIQTQGAEFAVSQAKNNLYAAQANRDGVCGNSPKYACDAANAQVAAAETGVQQAQLGVDAVSKSTSPDQLNANLSQAIKTAQTELARLRALQPEYTRLDLNVGLASGSVSQGSSRLTDLALQPSSAALQNQIAVAQSNLDKARGSLANFESTNGIGDLTTEISSQSSLVNDLQRQVLTSEVQSAGGAKAIAGEDAELKRMTDLLPQYEQLNRQVTQIQSQISQLQTEKLNLLVNNSLMPNADVKVLDSPRLQPNAFWEIAFYTLGTLLGAFVGLFLVYLFAYFDRTPRTTADVQDLLGVPVLARVPKAS